MIALICMEVHWTHNGNGTVWEARVLLDDNELVTVLVFRAIHLRSNFNGWGHVLVVSGLATVWWWQQHVAVEFLLLRALITWAFLLFLKIRILSVVVYHNLIQFFWTINLFVIPCLYFFRFHETVLAIQRNYYTQ